MTTPSPPDDPEASTSISIGRRRALVATGGLTASALAGCLGLGQTTGGSDVPVPVLGNADADVTVAAFVDFACPHCATYELQHFPEIRSNYVESDRIRYEHHDFPLPDQITGPASRPAANAAREVQDRAGDDAFFEYATALFENQRSLAPDTYASLANDQGLDGAAVREAATQKTYSDIIDADKQNGRQRDVSGTPTIFVNDTKVDTYRYSDVSVAIDSALSG